MFTFQHLVNKYKIMSAIRFISKLCNFIQSVMPFFSISSVFLKHVYGIVEKEYNVDSLLHNERDAIVARICYIQNNEKQMRDAFQI